MNLSIFLHKYLDQRNVGTDNDTDTYRNDKRRKFNRSQFEPSIDLKFEELNFDKESKE